MNRAQAIPLCGPPGFEYETTGPWFVCHNLDGKKAGAWVLWTLDSAILRFWLHDKTASRRVMVDALGVTVLGVDGTGETTAMCGTRQTCDATLKMTKQSAHTELEAEVEILRMTELLRDMDGNSA